jgi:alkanesulfonate monooxygenase SsuD/methylene tetrahydromethanopterin reductase-like flavin-dependent oxidoreductase (luciferase family)
MKFYTFDELTYPDVPAEIGPEERFTNRFCDPLAVNRTYHEHLDEWAICEDLGFDGAFVNEHHFTAVNIQPACNITATAIIMRTRRMKVGVIGNVIPLRHPVRTAEEFAMLDCLSGGRFIAGIVRGVPQEYVSYNIDPFSSRDRLKEAYDVIHKGLTEEVFDYDGKYWQLTGVSIWPKPIQRPLPFWMPTGSLETIEFAAERHIVGAQVFYPSEAFRDAFETYRRVARERFAWEPRFDNFVGARFIHVAETNERAVAEAQAALAYLFRVFSRPVNNPAPVPGLHSDRSFAHRTNVKRDFPSPDTPFEQMREDGFVVCGDPDYVTRWLERDMKTAGYGHFLGMFHIGNMAHERVIAAKRLFAEHVMPALRGLNVDSPESERTAERHTSSYEIRDTQSHDALPLYGDYNYVLAIDCPEVVRRFAPREHRDFTAGWEMRVPERGADGFPYQIIFAGPTAEHRGSAIRLHLVSADGDELPDEAEVRLEILDQARSETQTIFEGRYGHFRSILDQHAPNAALSAQRRGVATDRHVIRLTIVASDGGPWPDLTAEEWYFEIECFKHWLNVTA